eukprot:symbB.v1.2.039004.t1/scaffold6289.1/size19347/1
MKMHPVVTLMAVTFFGFIWGPTGMLLSVPMMTYLKAVLLVEHVPAGYRDPLLILIEGDRTAPKRLRSRLKARRIDEAEKRVVSRVPGIVTFKAMLSMDSANLKAEVVVNRLQQHMDAFREASFDNVKKDTDILTGQRRRGEFGV